jgi:hypothetical protein
VVFHLTRLFTIILLIQDVDPNALPLLIVLLCDFEQFDTTVVKDLLYICRFYPPLLVIVLMTLTLVSVVFTSAAFPSFLFSHYQALPHRRTSTPPTHVLLLHCSVFATLLSHQVPRSSKEFCQRYIFPQNSLNCSSLSNTHRHSSTPNSNPIS